MSHVHRPGRIGRDELDQDALGRLGATGPERLPGGQHLRERVDEPRSARKRFRKPGPATSKRARLAPSRRLQLLAEPLGDGARWRAQPRREQQRGVRRVVAEVRARRTLQHDPPARAVLAGGLSRQLAGSRQHGLTQAVQRRQGTARQGSKATRSSIRASSSVAILAA